MKAFFILLSILILSACNSEGVEKTKELNKNNALLSKNHTSSVSTQNAITQKERILKMNHQNQIILEKIRNSSQKELATINAQNEQKLQELKLEKQKMLALQNTKQKVIEANNSLEIAKINSKTVVQLKEKQTSFYKIVAFIVLVLILFWLLLRYINLQSKRRHEANLKEQDLNYQAYTQESKMKHQNISKMLDIISDEKSDNDIKKEITKILTHNKNNLIEYRKK